MTKTDVVTLLIILPLMLAGALAVQEKAPEFPGGGRATVVLHIVDSYGSPVKYKVESFHDMNQPDIDLAGQFDGLTFKHAVRWKTYEFRVVPLPQQRKFPAFKERIFVGEPSTFAVFAVQESIPVADSDQPWPVTNFILDPAPNEGGLVWVTVRPAFLPQIHDPGTENATVSRNGTFTLHGLHGGRYVITVAQGSRIPRAAIIDIPLLGPSNPIKVQLK